MATVIDVRTSINSATEQARAQSAALRVVMDGLRQAAQALANITETSARPKAEEAIRIFNGVAQEIEKSSTQIQKGIEAAQQAAAEM